MARVTVEDCVSNIPNRFELVGLAAQRAKQIFSGDPIRVDRDNDKDAVVSLREIADKMVDYDHLREEIIEGYSRYQRPDVVDGVDAARNVQVAGNAPSAAEVSESYEEDTAATPDVEAQLDAPEGMSFSDEEVQAED
jgi:DNA-directed RNA polymerase subunit omega